MTAGYELSPQQRKIFAHACEKETAGVAILLDGRIDVDKLRSRVEGLLQRHEILRTAFQRRTGFKFPFQVVRETAEFAWQNIDVSAAAPHEQTSAIEKLLRESSRIDIEKGQLSSFCLVKLAPARHALVLAFSVLCVDDYSLNKMLADVARLYDDQGPEEALQYADYSEWQNEVLRDQSPESNQVRAFWAEIPSSIPALSLPLERKTPVAARSWQTISMSLPSAAAAISAVELEDFLLACWQALLAKLTGQQEFILSYVSENRTHEEFIAGIGPFAKALPLHCALSPDIAFADIRVSGDKRRAAAIDSQDYLPASLGEQPAPAAFAWHHVSEQIASGGIRVSELARVVPQAGLRLQLRCCMGDSVSLFLDFDRAHFAQDTAAGVADAFSVLCQAAAEDPSRLVGALPVTSEPVKEEVVRAFNRTAADFPRKQCIHQLFEAQVAAHPERPALRFGERELSYLELNQEANRIAHLLRKHQVAPDVPVALCVERSAEMIIALLGILKAGGCYVPLLPENPKGRLAHQLSETGAPVIVTEERHLERLPDYPGKIICLDRDRALLRGEPVSDLDSHVSPQNLVYVIYTSGSTGTPKGVAVRHFNLVNYSHFICQRLKVDQWPAGLHFATVSTIAADLGNTSIFPALISGGCLHVISFETAMSPSVFSEYASQHPIDVLKITPSHLSTLLNADAGAVLPRKCLLLGGEATRWDLVDRVRKLGSCSIFNHYGPTEATVGCCTFEVTRTAAQLWDAATVPIGRPIANDEVYIVDAQMEPLPPGVAGELCIGGTGLAQGYLNQPQETALRFVPNPFSNDPSARLYRTGDLARFLPDGNIEFLGRIDQQVKIRGFRVEPAEIEAVIKRHASVERAAIVAYDSKSGEKRLAAYVVARGKSEDLRAFLSQQLPEYMVPASIVMVDSLPLTPNGKLDLRALPAPEERTKREVVPPRTSDEEKLTAIWQEVLKTDGFGVTDNFFDLGGHSLLATQIISRIRNVFSVHLTLQGFLEHPTIAALAEKISQSPPLEAREEDMARLLQELEGMSEEDAERLLAAEMAKEQAGSGS
ncbi:MAG TPA: amino acid adenylation domain-containing protein [Terriglobales bacterium]